MHLPLKLERDDLNPLFWTAPDVVNKTARFSSHDGLSIPEVLQLLREHGVLATAIEGIFRGQPGDSSVYVEFKTLEALEDMKKSDMLYVGDKNIDFDHLGRQNISIRVHWLPLYVDDNLLRRILCDFGTIKRIVREWKKTDEPEGVKLLTGIRRVDMEVTQEAKMAIPHLIVYPDGTRSLVTLPGRQPLCLKCNTVGHVRRDCANKVATRSYAQITNTVNRSIQVINSANKATKDAAAKVEAARKASASEAAAREAAVKDAANNKSKDENQDINQDEPKDNAQANPQDANQEMKKPDDDNQATDTDDMDSQDISTTKRRHEGESDDDDDYVFPKNKTQKVPDGVAAEPISTSNSFVFGSNPADVETDLADMLGDD